MLIILIELKIIVIEFTGVRIIQLGEEKAKMTTTKMQEWKISKKTITKMEVEVKRITTTEKKSRCIVYRKRLRILFPLSLN